MDNFADLPLKRRPYLFFVLNNELGAIEFVFKLIDLLSELSNTFWLLLLVFSEYLLGYEVSSLSFIAFWNQLLY